MWKRQPPRRKRLPNSIAFGRRSRMERRQFPMKRSYGGSRPGEVQSLRPGPHDESGMVSACAGRPKSLRSLSAAGQSSAIGCRRERNYHKSTSSIAVPKTRTSDRTARYISPVGPARSQWIVYLRYGFDGERLVILRVFHRRETRGVVREELERDEIKVEQVSRTRHCEAPTGPARSGRPDNRLRAEAIQSAVLWPWIASFRSQ